MSYEISKISLTSNIENKPVAPPMSLNRSQPKSSPQLTVPSGSLLSVSCNLLDIKDKSTLPISIKKSEPKTSPQLIDPTISLAPIASNLSDQCNFESIICSLSNEEPSKETESDIQKSNKIIVASTEVTENFIPLKGFIDECTSFEEALDVLNSEGVKYGVGFKRGNIHYYDDKEKKEIRDRRVICNKKARNKPKNATEIGNEKKDSVDNLNRMTGFPNKDCPVYYKFVYDENDSKMSFSKCEETHNHPSDLLGEELTQQMKEDIKIFNKKSKIIHIKESLEKKYYIQLDYQTVYREFRKLYPRFGKDDAQNVVNMLKEKKIYNKIYPEASNTEIKRLFFATPQMIASYKQYGDIVLIDSTYRINHYNIPLVVYSGLDSAGRNILFGLAIVNDETEETHFWCLNEFFGLHKKYPLIIVTDQDLALLSVLKNRYPEIVHLLCQWHILQNLKKHFAFLQYMNLKTLYNKVLTLPFVQDSDEFEKDYTEIEKH